MSDAEATVGLFTVETPESVAFEYELAGLGSRGLALMLDMLAITGLALAESAVFALAGWLLNRMSEPLFGRLGAWLAGALIVIIFATFWGYFVFGEVMRNGRTWGKRRIGIRVVRDDGSRVNAGDSVVRNLLRIIDVLPGNYAVGMFCILFTKRNKRIGDMAAGTVVVRDTGDDDLVFEGGGVSPAVLLAREYLTRRLALTEAARAQVAPEVLAALGATAEPGWDEPMIAGAIDRIVRAAETPAESGD